MITEKLKTETRQAHEQLESHAWLKLLLSDQLTPEAYAKVLSLFYGYFAPLEQQLTQFPELLGFLPDLPERRKTAALLADLKNLNLATPAVKPPLFTQAPLPGNVAACFGTLYVLEGSTLGGRFIAQQVGKTLGAKAANSLGFFTGYGAQTGLYWKGFREALGNFNNLNVADEVIISSATATFQQFYRWLNINEHHISLRATE